MIGSDRAKYCDRVHFLTSKIVVVNNLTLGTITTDIIQVDWAQIPGASSYILTLTDKSGETQPQTVTITDPTTIAHAFQNLTPGQDYSISLTGIAGGAPVDGGTVMATTMPLPPQNVKVSAVSATSATLQWQPPAGGTYDGFLIVHGPTDGSAPPTLEPVPPGSTVYTVNGINTATDFVSLYTTSGEQTSVPGFPVDENEFGDPFPVGQVTDTTGTTVVDFCTPSPCLNGGVCVNGANTFICQCPTGFTGTRCETTVNNCDPVNPCQNGGLCITQIGSYACVCLTGFVGTHCETNANDCIVNQCLNNGVCVDGVNTFTCLCPQGFDGTLCQNNVNDCNPNPCLNGGICNDGINTHTCTCQDGFTGTNCDLNVDNCSPSPCANGGFCVDGVNTFNCQCPDGFTGIRCETTEDDNMPWLAIIISVAVIGTLLILTISVLLTKHFCKRQPNPNSETCAHSEDKSPTHIGMSNLSPPNHHANPVHHQRSNGDYEIPNPTDLPTYQALYAAIQE
ncbi:uncharacterized protein [Amphiura filiformis]|uniref:uncharacterized protein n=1 Tax=Amphiura filiformis TaxID=82378 RepID=UPI003B221A1E